MNLNQFEELKEKLSDTIYGQSIGAVIKTDSGFSAESRKLGYNKITRFNVRIVKNGFVGVCNTSTGAEKYGLEVKQLEDSNYEWEKLGGLFSHLKSNPSKKYMTFRWDNDKQNVHESIYIDLYLNVIGYKFDDVKHLFTPSYVKSITEGYGRQKVLKSADINVIVNTVKIENIVVLRICGIEVIDPLLTQYAKFII